MFVNGLGWNEQSLPRTFHRCFLPSFGSFGQAASEMIFKNRPIRNNNCLWRPCLLIDRYKLSNVYRESSIDASYQVSVHLAERFQRRRLICEMLTDDGRRTPSDGKSTHCLWQGELKNNISEILTVYIINSITKSYILNIKILVTEYALTIKLVGGTLEFRPLV